MSENPYESPQAERPDDSMLIARTGGPWRDGGQLVVCLSDARLPPRCVKTDDPADGQTVSLTFEWLPPRSAWWLLLGAPGEWLAKSMHGRKVSLEIPLSAKWQAEQRRRSRLGWRLIVLGMLSMILGTVAYVAALSSGANDASTLWLLVVILGGPLVSIGGVLYLAVRHDTVVNLSKVIGDYAWLSGAHPLFLERLPPLGGFRAKRRVRAQLAEDMTQPGE